MTQQSKATLEALFQTGDVPTGQNYTDMIDSAINAVETGIQTIGGPINPTEVITPRVSASNANFTVMVSANALNVATDVSASNGTVYASAMRSPFTYHGSPLIVSAAGTAQATGAALTGEICRLQGATDAQNTGFRLLANQQGWVQYLANECTVSANLWPPTGGHINGLSNNTAFSMTANTPYIVIHSQASAYAVK